jgi:hypothetical protein
MKRLLLLPLLLILTGCVTYYYPQTALEDDVYYAGDDPEYVNESVYVGSVDPYPWASMDYFYLGYSTYPYYSHGGFYFSTGFGYYSPWYYPYYRYSYYSPWYAPRHYYPYYSGYMPYSGHCSHPGPCHHKKKRRYKDDWDEGYARDNHARRERDREDGSRSVDDWRAGRTRVKREKPEPVRRYVSASPSGQAGDRGRVIRKRTDAKPGKTRLHVDSSSSVEPAKKTAREIRVVQKEQRARTNDASTRYRTGTKKSGTRTLPVEVSPASGKVMRVSQTKVRVNRQGGSKKTGKAPVSEPVPKPSAGQRQGKPASQPAKSNHQTKASKPARERRAPKESRKNYRAKRR